MTGINSSKGLVRALQTQLEQDWDRFRGLEADDSARGSSYEEALEELLSKYLGGRYDILRNCSVMDENLACFEAFETNAENEIDVVALFQQSSPRIIITERQIKWIPLEGVAFLCEVKSRIDKGRLESDLRKLRILRQLEKNPEDRFQTKIKSEYTVDHQLHCLVYDKASISDSTLSSLIEGSDVWDLILIVDNDTLIINDTLSMMDLIPSMVLESKVRGGIDDQEAIEEYIKSVENKNSSDCISLNNGLFWYILVLSGTIPMPLDGLTTTTFSKLVKRSVSGIDVGVSTSVSESDS